MLKGINKFKNLNSKQKMQHICVWVAILSFLIFLYFFNKGINVKPLMDESNGLFERATVVEVVSGNDASKGEHMQTQELKVKLKTGEFKGEIVNATNIDSYLYGAKCNVGTNVIVQVSEFNNKVSASVYNYDRTDILLMIIIFFFVVLVIIGKSKGFKSALGLIFTFICIIYLYIPLMYIGVSPFISAVLVVIITTLVTMYFISGFSIKSLCVIIGTICGVVISGVFASLFGLLSNINGYNVQDIESLIYIGQNSKLSISGLLFSGILISSLGAVMDVAMSISTTIEELVYHNPDMTVKQLFKSGIKIGGDMMGTMSNTLILAFTGGALSTLVIFYSYNVSFLQLFNSYDIGIEIIQGISGSLGVVLTIPFVSIIASLLMHKNNKRCN